HAPKVRGEDLSDGSGGLRGNRESLPLRDREYRRRRPQRTSPESVAEQSAFRVGNRSGPPQAARGEALGGVATRRGAECPALDDPRERRHSSLRRPVVDFDARQTELTFSRSLCRARREMAYSALSIASIVSAAASRLKGARR